MAVAEPISSESWENPEADPNPHVDSWERTVALVTGVGRVEGIGFEVCRQLAQGGFAVLLTARNEEKARARIAREQEKPGDRERHVGHGEAQRDVPQRQHRQRERGGEADARVDERKDPRDRAQEEWPAAGEEREQYGRPRREGRGEHGMRPLLLEPGGRRDGSPAL